MNKKKRLVVLVEPSVKKTFTLKCIEKDTTHQEVLESAVNKFIKQKDKKARTVKRLHECFRAV